MGGNGSLATRPTAILAGDTGLALLRVAGEDATAFLNAQATALLDENAAAAQFSALADPAGRVLLVFYAWREDDGWTLALAASELEWLCAHLARFVFRARVRMAPLPDASLFGLAGEEASAAFAAAGLPPPLENHAALPGAIRSLRLVGDRWLVTGEEKAVGEAARAVEPYAQRADADAWKQARIAVGEVEIRAETRGRFLPQMLGLVEFGAVNFRKGCYPGQEVIARLQHRGQVKRKLALFELDVAPEAGARIDLEETRIEVLDSIVFGNDGALVQAIAPFPLPPMLSRRRFLSSALKAEPTRRARRRGDAGVRR